MVDYKPTLKAALDTILPTYYELFVDSSTATPCITFIETANTAQEEGNTIRYSRPAYQIKIWGDDIATLAPYATSLDTKMFELGFKRAQYNELVYGTHIQLIFKYEALFIEN